MVQAFQEEGLDCLNLKMKQLGFFKTLVTAYQ